METAELNIPPYVEKVRKLKKGDKKASRALQTFFRNSYRTHINLSALADRKSNIMVRLNSLLISILIIFFKSILDLSPMATLTGVIFLVSALISLIFAAMSARPSVTQNINNTTLANDIKNNLFFFGNFVHLDYLKYKSAMSEMLSDSDLIYDNMVSDLYYLGKVLDKKFILLKYSYNTFIWGLILTVASFLFTVISNNLPQ